MDKEFTIPPMIKLSNASLCMDCDTVFASKRNKEGTGKIECPACGSRTVHYMTKFLDRVNVEVDKVYE